MGGRRRVSTGRERERASADEVAGTVAGEEAEERWEREDAAGVSAGDGAEDDPDEAPEQRATERGELEEAAPGAPRALLEIPFFRAHGDVWVGAGVRLGHAGLPGGSRPVNAPAAGS